MLRLHRAEEALQHSTRDYILCRLSRSLPLHKQGPACQLASRPGMHALSVLLVDCTVRRQNAWTFVDVPQKLSAFWRPS